MERNIHLLDNYFISTELTSIKVKSMPACSCWSSSSLLCVAFSEIRIFDNLLHVLAFFTFTQIDTMQAIRKTPTFGFRTFYGRSHMHVWWTLTTNQELKMKWYVITPSRRNFSNFAVLVCSLLLTMNLLGPPKFLRPRSCIFDWNF